MLVRAHLKILLRVYMHTCISYMRVCLFGYICVYVSVCIYIYWYECMYPVRAVSTTCCREERERERARARERQRERERVCVCEREREIKRERVRARERETVLESDSIRERE